MSQPSPHDQPTSRQEAEPRPKPAQEGQLSEPDEFVSQESPAVLQGPLPDLLPLKDEPKYGHYPWWPPHEGGEDGNAWVHPDDVALARESIPSPRIWRRTTADEPGYLLLSYGPLKIRVKRTLWCEVHLEGLGEEDWFKIGDWVEVKPQAMKNDPHTGVIREMLWDETVNEIRYQIEVAGVLHEKLYPAHDFKHIEPTKPQEWIEIQPRHDDGPELEIDPEGDIESFAEEPPAP